MRTIKVTDREARVAHDVLLTIAAYTWQEAKDHFGWTARDLHAWASILAKLDNR